MPEQDQFKKGVNFYIDWASRLDKSPPFPSLIDSPITETFGKNTAQLEDSIGDLHRFVNPNGAPIWQTPFAENIDFFQNNPELSDKIKNVNDALSERQKYILETANRGINNTFQDGAVFDFKSLAPMLEMKTGVKFMQGLNRPDALGAQHEAAHLAVDLLGMNPDQRTLTYNNSRLPTWLAKQIKPRSTVLQAGPFLPLNESLAQVLNRGLSKVNPGIEDIRAVFDQHFFGPEATNDNNKMLQTVLTETANKGQTPRNSLQWQHQQFTAPFSNKDLAPIANDLELPELIKQKIIDPLGTRLEIISKAQGSGFRNPFYEETVGKRFLKRDYQPYYPGIKSHILYDTIRRIDQLAAASRLPSSESTNGQAMPSMFKYNGTGDLLFNVNPIGAAWEGAKDLLRNKPAVVGLGGISSLNSDSSKTAASEDDWNKVGQNAALNIGKELIIDASINKLVQKYGQSGAGVGASRFPVLGRVGQALGPIVEPLAPYAKRALRHALPSLIGYNLFELGRPNGVLQTALTKGGEAWDSLLNNNPNLARILPRSDTGYGDETGKTAGQHDIGKQAGDFIMKAASEAGNQLKDVGGATYSQIDTLFGGALPGGVNPRFNGFNATRDLTPAQQLAYRRGGGDAARRQNPGLTPQEVIERGRQAAAAARTQQQNRTSANRTAMGRGSNTGRPANTRPSPSGATQTPVAPSRSRTQPQRQRTGQNSSVRPVVIGGVDVGNVLQGWARGFNWNR